MNSYDKYMWFPVILIFFTALLFPEKSAYAGSGTAVPISWSMLIITLCGGLALFLYGMEKMSSGMKKAAGNRIRSILSTLTRNKFIAFAVGALVTMVIQSSSATTVILVSFVHAELMSFVQTLGVILGANIGTTITAQLVAFKLTDYALVLVAGGFALRMLGKNDKLTSIGNILLGFGILFYGMKLMGDAMKPLRTYPEFIDLMKGLENPIPGILTGALFTALVQSSSASTGIVIVLAQQGLITIEAGIPLILGANVGTCITAGFACIGTSREAKRVAFAHVLFNIGGVLLFVFWIPQFADLIGYLATTFNIDTARQIAHAHTLFNVSVGLFFLPFVPLFARLILRLLPDSPLDKAIKPKIRYLDKAMISTPALALQLARSEITSMVKLLVKMHQAVILPFISSKTLHDKSLPKLSLLAGIEMRENKINFIEEHVRKYLLKIGRQELAVDQGGELNGLLSLLENIELMGDVITHQMVPLIEKKQRLDVDFSAEGKKELLAYHGKIKKQLERLQNVLMDMDISLAQKIRKKKKHYARFDARIRKQHLQRLLAEKKESLATHLIHVELLNAMHQMNNYSAEIAKFILQSSGPHSPKENNGTAANNDKPPASDKALV